MKGQTVTGYVKSMLNAYLDNVAAISRASGGDKQAFDRMYNDYRQGSFKLEALRVKDMSLDQAMSAQSIGFLILFMMNSAINLSELILKSREDRTYFRILSSPISARTYVLANLTINMLIMTAQIALALFFLRFVFHINPGLPIASLGGIMLLFALVSVGLSLVIVAFATSSSSASSMSRFIIIPSCLVAGCFFPPSIMPEALRRIGDFTPQRWVLQSINQLQAGESGQIGLNMAILAAFALVFFLIAAYKFSRSNDTRSFV